MPTNSWNCGRLTGDCSNHFRCKFQSFHSVPAAGFNLLQFGESSRPSDSIFSYSLYFECKRSWFEKSSKQHVSRDKQRAGARKLLNRKEVRYVAVRVRRVSLAKMQFPAIKFTRVRFRRVYATHTHTYGPRFPRGNARRESDY